MAQLLTRDQFRNSVFDRDRNTCVFCDKSAVDAHHILERRLWGDGGYYINNGASVCEQHHIECEMTTISVETVREACGITKKIIPEHLYDDVIYDKWGNIVLPNGQRMKGELFSDASVQKILTQGGVLDQFIRYYKYPRTYHLPWSLGITDDDKVLKDVSIFNGREVVITEKLDGENSNLYSDYYHARSIDGRSHWSRDWVKNFHSKIMGDIPEGYRICGENLFAKHSIGYTNLSSYFYGFGIWNEDTCLSWDETLEWFQLISIQPVNVLYRGMFDENIIRNLQKSLDFSQQEGYVLRVADSFKMSQFKNCVAKFVRKNHIVSSTHWMYDRIEQNKIGQL